MKTEEEITKGLDICQKGMCRVTCPYYGDGFDRCREALEKDARDLVVQLQEENRALRTECMVNRKTTTIINMKDNTPDQTAKQDIGKPDPTLVPQELIMAVAEIRRIGTLKYHNDPDNWKKVDKKRFRAAAYRHWIKYVAHPERMDDESGRPNLWHCATNIAFLCAMEQYDIEGCKW